MSQREPSEPVNDQ